MNSNRTNDEVCKRSGTIKSSDPLVSLLYNLMRDDLPAGRVEKLVMDAVDGFRTIYTNGWLAQYAIDLATSLQADKLDREKLIAWTKSRIELTEEAIADSMRDELGEKILEGALAAYGRLLSEIDSGRLDVEEK